MSNQGSLGTTIAACAASPGTFNGAGYAALTWAEIGEVTNISGEIGRKYNTGKTVLLKNGATQKAKTSFDDGQATVEVNMDRTDPGQVIVKAAVDVRAPYSFRVTYPNGDIDYFQALVMSFPTKVGSAEDKVMGTISMEVTTTSAGVGIVPV